MHSKLSERMIGDPVGVRRKAAGAAAWPINLGIAVAICLGIFLRIYAPGSDSPSWEYIFNTDEGHYSYCAQNKITHGHFFVNDAKYALAYPLFSVTQYLFAAPWGEHWGIARYRFVSIASGLVLSLLLGLFFPPGRLRWSAIALGALSFMGIVHARYGIPETMLTAMMVVCVLLAAHGWNKGHAGWLTIAGLSGTACIAVKFTGIVMLPVLLGMPLLCRTTVGRRRFYYRHILTGLTAGGLLYAVIVVLPYPAEWFYFRKSMTTFALGFVAIAPAGFLKNLSTLLLSPALHTMPLLLVAAFGWSFFIFLPRALRGETEMSEAAILLWFLGGVLLLAITSFQPPRYQMILFPPTMIMGLRFFLEVRTLTAGVWTVSVAAVAASIYVLLGFDASLAPEAGAMYIDLSTRLLTVLSIAVMVCGIGILYGRCLNAHWRTLLLCGVILFELTWQIYLLGIHVVPAYRRPDQWQKVAAAVRKLESTGEVCFTGDNVQDISLRVPINAIPTFHLLDQQPFSIERKLQHPLSDAAIASFFAHQSPRPTHIFLLDFNVTRWLEAAPRFMSHLEPNLEVELDLSGIGRHTLYLYRINDWEDVDTPERHPSFPES